MKTIHVCIGSACHLKGSYDVIQTFERLIEENKLNDKIELKAAFCLGECAKAASVKIDNGPVISVSPETAEEIFKTEIMK